jgi:hypothetical protein
MDAARRYRQSYRVLANYTTRVQSYVYEYLVCKCYGENYCAKPTKDERSTY